MTTATYGAGRYGTDTYGGLSSPGDLRLVDRDVINSTVTIAWNLVLGDNITYSIYRNGTKVGTTTVVEYSESVPPGTHTYQVYAVQATFITWDSSTLWESSTTWVGASGASTSSPPSNVLTVYMPSTSDPIGSEGLFPVFEVDGEPLDLDNVLLDTTIDHGTQEWSVAPTPNTMSMALVYVTPAILQAVTVGSVIRFELAGSTRFYGRVTDTALTWGATPRLDLTVVGPLEHLGWSRVTGTRPAESDHERIRAILDAVYGAQAWSLSPGIDSLIATDWGTTTLASSAAEVVTRSTSSRLTEDRDGTVRWSDRLTRETPTDLEIPAAALVVDSVHLSSSGEIANRAEIGWGNPSVIEAYEVAVPTPYDRRAVTLSTALADQASAAAYARRIVTARKTYLLQTPRAVLPVTTTAWGAAWPLLEAEVGQRLTVTNWPYPLNADTTGFVEGWQESITVASESVVLWEITYGLSHPALSAADSYPLNPTATTLGATSIRVAWQTHPRAVLYEVHEGTTMLYSGTALSYDHTGLAQGSSHTYTVTSYRSDSTVIEAAQCSATTASVGSADPVTITYAQAHGGACRISITRPADADWASATIVVKSGAWPTGPTDGIATSVTASGTVNIGGPGATDRPDQTWYVCAYSRNTLGQDNTAQVPTASIYFLRSPIDFRPAARNAYGATGGWESMNRVRNSNTSSNTYRGVWAYGTPTTTLGGRAVAGCQVYVVRGDGGPSGPMAARIGYHGYASIPAGRPDVSGARDRGSVPRNAGAWVDAGADYGQAISNGTAHGLGLGGADSANVSTVWVGQAHSDDGLLRLWHSDFG